MKKLEKIESEAIAIIICDIQMPASITPCKPILIIDMRIAIAYLMYVQIYNIYLLVL